METDHGELVEHQQEEAGREEDAFIGVDEVEEDATVDPSGGAPMDEDDEEMDGQEGGDGHGAGEGEGMGREVFEDTSIAAFYSHRDSLFALSLHPSFPNPPLAISGGGDDNGYIWSTLDGSEVVKLGGHSDSVVAVGWSADGQLAATGGMDGKVRVWRRVKNGAAQDSAEAWANWEFLTNLEGPDEVVWLAWHPKGNVLAAGATDSTVWMWQLPSGNTMNVFVGHTGPVTCGRFTPDGKRLLTASEDSTLILWDPRSTTPVHKFSPEDQRFNMDGGIVSLCINPASTLALAGGASGGSRLVNLVTGTVIGALEGHAEDESVEAAEFVELAGVAGGAVVTAGTDGKACVWDVTTMKLRCEIKHDDVITSLAVHPSSPYFTTGSNDRTMRTWDARTGACVAVHKGFQDGVLGVVAGRDDGLTQGAETGGLGAQPGVGAGGKGWKVIGAGDEGVALVFRV